MNRFERAICEYEAKADREGCICEPKQVKDRFEPDGYSYNCQNCDNKECEYWTEYN